MSDVDLDSPEEDEEEVDVSPAVEDEGEDPTELVPGMVPMYNPLHVPLDVNYNGQYVKIGSKKTEFVPTRAALHAVGEDNAGGPLSQCGLRRLYGPEERFKVAAEAAGMSVLAWVLIRNAETIEEADKVAAVFISRNKFPGDDDQKE